MPTAPIETAYFKATGGTTSRFLQDHVGDVLNVKSFGAIGDNSNDDTASIQACFDAAFKTSGTPNGVTNAWKNRAVFFPSGMYKITSALTLTDVYGGLIFGTGFLSSQILQQNFSGGVVISSCIVTNGMSNCCFRELDIGVPGGISFNSTSCGFDLDWSGSGSVGLGNNLFYDCYLGAASFTGIGVRIAHGNNGGANNQFLKCGIGGNPAVLVEGAAAVNNLFQGGGYGGPTVIKCTAGSIDVQSIAFDVSSTSANIYISSPLPCSMQACRSESNAAGARFLTLIGGRATMIACTTSDILPFVAVLTDASGPVHSSLIVDSCLMSGDITAVTGSKLYFRGNNLAGVNFAAIAGVTLQGPI